MSADRGPKKPPAKDQARFFPVPIEAIDAQILQMDLYVRPGSNSNAPPTLYKSAGYEYSLAARDRLADQGIKFFYIPVSQHKVFREMLARQMNGTFEDKSRPAPERAHIIRASCSKMIEDTLLLPGQPEPIAAVGAIAESFLNWSESDPNGFSYLLDMSQHDFYTTTHMVNVGVGCGMLVKAAHPGDHAMFTAAVRGGLLHDLGKRNIDPDILNKEGKLDAAEWELIKSHPTVGYNELKESGIVSDDILAMVRDHHERLDGKGYPNGLKADQITELARICAIVDVFDAITAARPYRGPTPPEDSLKIMSQGRGTQFDPTLFDIWAGLVKDLVKKDPGRAPPSTGEPPQISLDVLIPNAFEDTKDAVRFASEGMRGADTVGADRRRNPRSHCDIRAAARFVRQCKRYPVAIGEPFGVQITDISRGGMKIRTPWPLSIGDEIDLHAPLPGGKNLLQRTRVVRVRRANDGGWSAGIMFIAQESQAAA